VGDGERNWDYRYAWVRDSTFALWGLYTLGFDREANDFFYFVADACRDGNDLQVIYGVGGERELEESSLPHLSGYEGATPGTRWQCRLPAEAARCLGRRGVDQARMSTRKRRNRTWHLGEPNRTSTRNEECAAP